MGSLKPGGGPAGSGGDAAGLAVEGCCGASAVAGADVLLVDGFGAAFGGGFGAAFGGGVGAVDGVGVDAAVGVLGAAFAAGSGTPVTVAEPFSSSCVGVPPSSRPEALTRDQRLWLLSVFSTRMIYSGGMTSMVMMPPLRFLKKIRPSSTASLRATVS